QARGIDAEFNAVGGVGGDEVAIDVGEAAGAGHEDAVAGVAQREQAVTGSADLVHANRGGRGVRHDDAVQAVGRDGAAADAGRAGGFQEDAGLRVAQCPGPGQVGADQVVENLDAVGVDDVDSVLGVAGNQVPGRVACRDGAADGDVVGPAGHQDA